MPNCDASFKAVKSDFKGGHNMVFSELSSQAGEFYARNGYIHLRLGHLPEFVDACDTAFDAARSLIATPPRGKTAFLNVEGVARHVVDIVRRKNMFRDVLKSEHLTTIYRRILGNGPLIFHARQDQLQDAS